MKMGCAIGALAVLLTGTLTTSGEGPAIDWATPKSGSYQIGWGEQFEVEVECTDDPDGHTIYVMFYKDGQFVESDIDSFGVSPSYRFGFGGLGTYNLQADCEDSFGDQALPNHARWTVTVASSAGGGAAPANRNGGSNSAGDSGNPLAGFLVIAAIVGGIVYYKKRKKSAK